MNVCFLYLLHIVPCSIPSYNLLEIAHKLTFNSQVSFGINKVGQKILKQFQLF